jgi:hypothetical protein
MRRNITFLLLRSAEGSPELDMGFNSIQRAEPVSNFSTPLYLLCDQLDVNTTEMFRLTLSYIYIYIYIYIYGESSYRCVLS